MKPPQSFDSANGNAPSWRFWTSILAAVVVTGLPGYVALFRTGAQVEEVQDKQQEVLQRIATLEAQNEQIIALLEEARRKLDEIQVQLP